jgi:hypothetical protein
MKATKYGAGLALTALALASPLPRALAAASDYEFRLTQTEVKKGDASVISAMLVDKRTGKTVPDAVIFARRLDMAPSGMETMTTPVEPLPSTEPGVYRFKAKLVMDGAWRLSLGAKVQGETGTIESKLVLKVTP